MTVILFGLGAAEKGDFVNAKKTTLIKSNLRLGEIQKIEFSDWMRTAVQALMRSLEQRDPYTFGHCHRVGYLARRLAAAAGLSPQDQVIAEMSALFHDLGKIGIPDTVLNKPGKLNDEEWAIIKQHPLKSVEIMSPLTSHKFFEALIPGVLHHHERLDGLGYPFGLQGGNIPLMSRLVLIVDTFDAMTSTRPYRKALPDEVAYKELLTFAGRQFDPHLVKIFVEAHPTWSKTPELVEELLLALPYEVNQAA